MANKNIKGITIEIGGDTTKLGKALEQSEKKSRNLQVELKQIQNSLKFNPDNIELLTQKQEVLTQSVKETSDKLDVLREAERQVIAQFERGEVAEEQVRALKREILKTENQLESMTSELRETSKYMQDLANGTRDAEKHTEEYQEALDKTTQELKDFGDKASGAFESIATGVGVLATSVTAVAGYATKLSTEFDQAYNLLQAQTGATAEEMEQLEESIDNIYKSNLGESMDDVARAMSTVKTQTKLSGQELEDVTKTALLMRDTFDFDVNESIRAVNSLINQFGLSADEAYNLIAQGAQKGLNQNGDLMDVINEYAVQFKQAGYNADEMFNMLVNGADAGTWSVDKLGDAVKEYNIRMTDGTAVEHLEKLGLNVDEVTRKYAEGGTSAQEATNTIIQALKGVENEQERYVIGQGIMGTMWEDLGEDAVYALLDTQGEISKTSDALENINEIRYDDIGSSLGGLKRTLETDVIKPLGEELKPVVEDAIEYVKENGPSIKETLSNIVNAIGKFMKVIVDNKDVVISAIVAIGTGLLVWNIVAILGPVISIITTLFTAIKAGVPIMHALNLAMNANPIGLIITLVAGLIAGFIALWNNCEGFRNFFLNMGDSIANGFKKTVDFITSVFTTVIDWFKSDWKNIAIFLINPFAGVFKLLYEKSDGFKNFIDGIVGKVKGFFMGIVDFFKNNWKTILLFMVNPFAGAFKLLYDKVEGFRNFIDGVVAKIKGFFAGLVDWFKNNWKTILLFLINPFAGVFKLLYDHVEGFRNFIDNIVNTIKEFFASLWNRILEIFSPAIEWFTQLFTSIKDTLFSIIEVMIGLVRGCWAMIVQIFIVAKDWFKSTVIDPIVEFFVGMWNTIVDFAVSCWNGIVNTFVSIAEWFNTKVIQPVIEFFKWLWTTVKDLAVSCWNGIVNTFIGVKDWFSDKVVTPVKNVFVGLWDGLKNGAKNAWEGIKTIFSNVTNFFRDIFSSAWQKVKNVFSAGGQIFAGIKDGIINGFKTVVNAIIGGINKAVSVPFNAINSMLNKIRSVSFMGISPFKDMWSKNPISIPKIPQLYRGGILKKGQVGLLEGNGAEAVVPLEKETNWINRIAQKMNELQDINAVHSNEGLSRKMDEMIQTMRSLKSTIVLDTGVLVGETLNQIDEGLGANYSLRERRI